MFWKSNDKLAGAYFPGDELTLTEVAGTLNQYETYLWVEGTAGHTQQQQVKLFARAFEDTQPFCQDDYISVTILDIDKIEWAGMHNGYTGDGKNNSNILDLNIAPGGGNRVFPENKDTTKTALPQTRVKLNVTLTVKPPIPPKFYIRSFDLDDPSNEIQFVDPNDSDSEGTYSGAGAGGMVSGINYSKDNDNRGEAYIPFSGVVSSGSLLVYKEGVFSGVNLSNLTEPPYAGLGISEILNISSKEFQVEYFYVSQMCGDNYKVAIINDPDFLINTRNRDKFDQSNIINTCTLTPTGQGTSIESRLCSPSLTVWRTFHIEYDRMENPTPEKNQYIIGEFSDFLGNNANSSLGISLVRSTQNASMSDTIITAHSPFADGSKKPGRFQNGTLDIGMPSQNLVSSNPSFGYVSPIPLSYKVIMKSPENILVFNKAIDITSAGTLPIKVTDTSGIEINAKVSNIQKLNTIFPDEFTITLSAPGLGVNFFNFNGGSIQIAGGPKSSDIKILNSLTIVIRGTNHTTGYPNALKIPIKIYDDDIVSDIIPLTFSQAKSTFEGVYIDIVNDGGGNIANNQSNLLFSRNIQEDSTDVYSGNITLIDYLKHYNLGDTVTSKWNSRNYFNDNYWGGYVISAWQYSVRVDKDPFEEPGIRGITLANSDDCLLTSGGNNIFIFHETCRDIESINPGISIEGTLAHELGHAFGLSHGDDAMVNVVNPCLGVSALKKMQIMMKEQPYTNTEFIPYHSNIIRSRISAPKTKL